MRTILAAAALALLFAACDSPTAPHPMGDGSVRFSDLNPQPLPPGMRLMTSDLNPQPLPPGQRFGSTTVVPGGRGVARTYACRVGAFEPPDPCSY